MWNLHGWVLCDLSTLAAAFIRNDRGMSIAFEESFFGFGTSSSLLL
jgi:hypothetical protein